MKKKPITRFVSVAMALGVGSLLASHASAQFQKAPAAVWTAQQVAPPPPAPVTRAVANASTDGMRRGGDVVTTRSLESVPVLNGFRFRFSNGDHELRQIGVMPASNSAVTMNFFDKNADDPFSAQATFYVFKGGGLTRGSVIAAGEGQFDIPLPTASRPPNTRLVLVGFEFWRLDDDHHVRMIGVWLNEARNVARVTLGDDSSKITDYIRRSGAPIGDSALASADPAARGSGVIFPSTSAADAAIRALKAKKTDDPYGVRLQYAYIPTTATEGDDYFTGNTRTIPQQSNSHSFPLHAVLAGFDFLFDNKDHHVLDIGVMPSLKNDGYEESVVRKKAPTGEYIAFQDKNRDDPIKWAVKFVKIRPNGQNAQ